jgi:hypothetical protein
LLEFIRLKIFAPFQLKVGADWREDKYLNFFVSNLPGSMSLQKNPADNDLGDNLETHLVSRGICYQFMFHLRNDSETNPVEDPAVEWKEGVAPFRKVATVRLASQMK